MEKVALKARVVNAILWLGATKILGQAITWFITIYVARILSPSDYGLMGMTVVFTGFLALFNELGLGVAIVQKKDLTEEDLSNVYWFILFVNTVLYALTFGLAPYIARFFNEPRLILMMRLIGLTFIISGFSQVSFCMLTRNIAFNRRAQAEFAGNMAGAAVTLLLAVKGFGVWSLVYGILALELVKNLLFYIFHPIRPKFVFSLVKIQGMLNFGIKVAISRLFWYIYSDSDFIIAGKLLGKTLLGYYSLAFQLASMPMEKIVSFVTHIALPAFSEVQTDPVLLRRYFLKMVRMVAFVTFPLFFGIFLVADDLVILFLTDKWAPIILPLRVLCVVSTLRAINAINAPLVMAIGKPGIVVFNNLLLSIVLPIAFFIGCNYGLEGLSYAWLFTFPPLFLVITSISIREIDLTLFDYFMELKHVILATAIMTIIVMLINSNLLTGADHPVRIIVTAVSGALAYFLYYAIFNRATFTEARSLFSR